MRKFLINKPCHDKYTGKKYEVGQIIEVSNARGNELAKLPDILTEIKEPEPEPEEEPAKRTRGRRKKEA